MAICSHPLATSAAIDVLRDGGNACDAALCAAITQTVVEPHMTTITGMLSLLYHDASSGPTETSTAYLNGNVNAPLQRLDDFREADIIGGRAIAVPGWWAAFESAHVRFGSLPRRRLMQPAIDLARDGFEISPYLFGEMYTFMAPIGRSAQGREMYMPDGHLLGPGDVLRQRRAADTLERLADEGSDYFYRGEFADDVVRVTRDAGGVLTRDDFERYEATWHPPVRGTYRDLDVVASTPPDSGGAHLVEILNLVEQLDFDRNGFPRDSADSLYWLARICEEVRFTGTRWSDEPDLALEKRLSKVNAAERMQRMRDGALIRTLVPREDPPPGSNHVTVVDAEGNVATLLHSCLSDAFGNGLWASGIHVCGAGVHFLRVMPEPGGRADVFVAPNIMFRDGRPAIASGSPSGSLLHAIVQNVINIADLGDDVETSVHRPRIGNSRGAGVMVEIDIDEGRGDALIDGMAERGLPLEVVPPWYHPLGAFEGVVIDGDTMHACADPRRTGSAQGV